MNWKICLIDSNLQRQYKKTGEGTSEERELCDNLYKSFKSLSKNPFAGKQIRYSLIPKIYIRKYGIDNLWKYDLPNGWRLVYSLASGDGNNICIIVEWFSHKQYERRFNY